MAILANRIKTVSILADFFDALKSFIVRFLSIILMCISISLISLASNTKVTSIIFDSIVSIINPIVSCYDAATRYVTKTTDSMISMWNASQENITLKFENAKLQKILLEAAQIKSENEVLKQQLKLSKELPYNIDVSARIISVFNGMYARGGIVNIGTKNGVEQNQIVISNGNIIGKITYTTENYSKIAFITDTNSRIPVITSISKEKAILAGDGHAGAKLLYISHNHKIKLGEYLFSSGDGKYYPYGIPIAKIIKVDGSYVYAEPVVNLNNIQFVSILTPKKQ